MTAAPKRVSVAGAAVVLLPLLQLGLVHGDALYVAANMPSGKRWPGEVRADPRVRIRVGGPVYERRAHWIEEPARARELLAAMNAKYGFDVSLDGEIWFFRLDPRPST